MGKASEFKSEDPGSDPLVGQGEEQVFYLSESTLAQTDVPDPPLTPPPSPSLHAYGKHLHLCARTSVKDPKSICRKRV